MRLFIAHGVAFGHNLSYLVTENLSSQICKAILEDKHNFFFLPPDNLNAFWIE